MTDVVRRARVLLILPTATYRAPDFLEAARNLGADVVVASEVEQTIPMGDRAMVIDLCDPVSSAERIAAMRPVPDAVIGVDEQSVELAAHVSAMLGRPHNPPEAVAVTRDKARQREILSAAGLEQPTIGMEIDGPKVVKAPSLSGSRGVIRADGPEEVDEAIRRVRAILAEAGEDGDVIVESYVPGAEVAVEGLLRGGELFVLAVFDKPDPLEGPYFEETIYVTPSRSPQRGEVVETVSAACRAIGLVEGPIHAEVRLPSRRPPVLLEVAARSIGGLCSRTLRFGAGISLEEVILRHALGLELGHLDRQQAASGVMMIPIASGGVLRSVGGLEEARAIDGVAGVEITVPVGHEVRALPEGDRYLGFIFASATTPADVEATLRDAFSALRVEIDPTR